MSVVLITTVQNYIGLSTDTKPSGVPAGSTFHEKNTGIQYIYDGTEWSEDLRLIYAISQAT